MLWLRFEKQNPQPFFIFMLGILILMLSLGFLGSFSGSGLWFNGNRGATACNVGSNGIFLDGIWIIQTILFHREP